MVEGFESYRVWALGFRGWSVGGPVVSLFHCAGLLGTAVRFMASQLYRREHHKAQDPAALANLLPLAQSPMQFHGPVPICPFTLHPTRYKP